MNTYKSEPEIDDKERKQINNVRSSVFMIRASDISDEINCGLRRNASSETISLLCRKRDLLMKWADDALATNEELKNA